MIGRFDLVFGAYPFDMIADQVLAETMSQQHCNSLCQRVDETHASFREEKMNN
jgi:hypothetical protein